MRRRVRLPLSRVLMVLCAIGSIVPALSQSASVDVNPKEKSVDLKKKIAFSAKVSGPNSSGGVTWAVDGVVGGNATVGTISPAGVYSTPIAAYHGRIVTISATSKGNSAVGSTTARLLYPTPIVRSIQPSKVVIGSNTLILAGDWFTPDAVVKINGQVAASQRVNSNSLQVFPVFMLNQPTKLTLTVETPGTKLKRSQPKVLTLDKPVMSGLSVKPGNSTVNGGGEVRFVAEMSNGMPTMNVRWAVNGVNGGYEAIGRIDEYGLYYAPDIPPSPANVLISATTMTKPEHAAAATLTITPSPPQIDAVFPNAVRPGNFTMRVRGNGFLQGAQVSFDSQPTTVTWKDSTSLIISGSATAGAGRRVNVVVTNPAPTNQKSGAAFVTVMTDPNANYKANIIDAGRLLEQATFGPDPASIDRVRELGVGAWLDEQFGSGESQYPDPPADSMMRRDWTERFFAYHMISARDQLRQRTVFALGQLMVVSSNKVRQQEALVEWQRLLSRNAFGNFRQLLKDVTLSPAMAKYLDMPNSEKASADGLRSPNENYAREIMQLFSIGLVELNLDGSPKLDAGGNTIPTYSQNTIKELARVFTGWGYPLAPGAAFVWPSKEYYRGVLQPYEPVHDTGSKTLLRGDVIPAGGGPQSDLEAALDNIFQHPNVGPFVATRLIRHFVKSNPSPAYIARVATVFNNNGQGVRGDLKAVIRAILTDSEARDASVSTATGKLKEPILHFTAVARALEGQMQTTIMYEPVLTREIGESLLESPTVFNFFSPLNKVGDTGLFGPEFQIYTPVTAMGRSNWVYQLLNDRFWRSIRINTEPYLTSTNDPTYHVSLIDRTFFYGRMSSTLRNELIDAVSRTSSDPGRRTMTSIWLATTSGEYLVQH